MNTEHATRTRRTRPVLGTVVMSASLALAALPGLANEGRGNDFGADNRELRMQLHQLEKATRAFNSFDVAQAGMISANETFTSP